MAITISSNFATQEELNEVLNQRGLVTEEPVKVETPAEEETPVAEEEAKPPVEEKKPEEKKPEPVVEPPAQKKPKPFLSKRELAERRAEELEATLQAERDQRAREKAEYDAWKAKLPPEESKKPEGPVRPKRPTLAEFEFDQDKFDAALAKHEDNLEAYYSAVAEAKVAEGLATAQEQRRQEETQRAENQRVQEFQNRMNEDVQSIEDWAETLEAISELPAGADDTPPVVDATIMASSIPAKITHYLMKDALNGGKELAAIRRMDEIHQVLAIGRIESKLLEAAKAPTPEVQPPRAEAPPPAEAPKPPAKKVQAKVEPPIEPVGSRTSGATPKLEQAKSAMEYFRLRAQGVNH